MKEILDSLPRVTHADYFIDTCFLYYLFEHQKDKEFRIFCEQNIVALTSFNIEEVLFHSHDVSHVFREHFRRFVKGDGRIFRYDVEVSPGDVDGEKKFIGDFDSNLLEIIPDPSDAVLLVAALKTHTNVLTRDKHHLFTTRLENYVSDFKLSVLNNFPQD